ncbi:MULTISPECIES: O-antigen polymerase [Pandoraea]|uniref:Oligosaccharide repeat unit polymerase n=1 Tax=Pandoraea capi TaxID=2508286 RepID=A0ABY6W8I6_9BURK|nr:MULTISPECIES: O-antigen polymerase [Pandoraea]MCI3204940.1 hypothetical protein [Pandoraea sp. LA3]MDN4582968.1 hypothetical protein [Pandoraea capi]VVE39580.1 hypothetical protein PCA20602_04092 [Pandoraea capi]
MRASAWMVLTGVLFVAHVLSWDAGIFYPFSDRYWSVMLIGLVCFYVGYWPTAWVATRLGAIGALCQFSRLGLREHAAHRTFLAMFWLFFLLGLLDRYLMVGPGFFLPDSVMQYRIIMTVEGGQNAIKGLSLGNFFLFLMPAYIIAYRRRFNAMSLALAVMAVIFNIYLSSARSALFVSALTAFYFWMLPKRINLNVTIRVAVVVSVLFYGFALIGQIVGKSTAELGFVVYAAAPLHAFDALLMGQGTLDGYFLSFYPIHSILANFFDFTPTTILPNVFTPLPTNVYTMFGVYFIDYGTVGLYCAMFLIGLLSGTLDRAYRKTGNGLLRAWAAVNMTVLSLSVFYDYYTTSGVIWMSIALSPFFFSRSALATKRSERVAPQHEPVNQP